MQKNSYSFNNFSIDEAMKLAQSEAGQRLLSLLQETKGDALRTAMDQAVAGDYSNIQKTLQLLLASDQAKELLNQLRGEANG